MKNKLSVIATEEYSAEALLKAVEAHFTAFNMESIITPEKKVLIKPNLLMKRSPDMGTTTHPLVVEAIISKLKSMGVNNITIADSPGGPFTKSALEAIYSVTGYKELAQKTGVALNYDTGFKAVKNSGGVCSKEFNIINPVADADIIINVPKFKTHGMVVMSAGVKNLFGCVPGLQKPELHFRFNDKYEFCGMLVDLCETVKPTLTIVDAVVSMEGNGPSSGELKKTGFTISAMDIHALDYALCSYINLKAEDVLTVKHAMERQLSPGSMEEIIWLNEKLEVNKTFTHPDSHGINFEADIPKFLRRPAKFVIKNFLTPRPVIYKKTCIGCGKCEESCAPGAVKVVNKKAVIDYKKCIKCYCCHEMCPIKSIGIKKTVLSR